jgi:hypothetical protein
VLRARQRRSGLGWLPREIVEIANYPTLPEIGTVITHQWPATLQRRLQVSPHLDFTTRRAYDVRYLTLTMTMAGG